MADPLDQLSDEELMQLAGGGGSKGSADPLDALSDDELMELAQTGSNKTGALEAAKIGLESAGTFGARGFLKGVAGGLGTAAGVFQGLKEVPFGERLDIAVEEGKKQFGKSREAAVEEEAKAFADQPAASIAGNLGGAVLSSPLLAAKGLAGAIKLGTASGAGRALSEADSAGEAIEKVATGAASGALMYGAGQGLLKIGKGLKNIAGKQAFRALGPRARDAAINLEKGRVGQIGQALLDNKVIEKLPKNYDKLATTLSTKLAEAGDDLGMFIDKLDDIAVKEGLEKVGVDPLKVALGALDDVQMPKNLPGADKFNQSLDKFATDFFEKNPQKLGIRAAEELKRQIASQIKWDRLPGTDIPMREQFLRALYRSIKNETENTAFNIAGMGEKALTAGFKGSKNTYGLLKEASKILDNKQARELANRIVSPSDYLSGGIGAAAGFASGDDIESRIKNMAIGASLGLANKVARERGPQFNAIAAKNLSNLILGASPQVTEPVKRVILNKLPDLNLRGEQKQETAFERRMRGN